MKRPDGISLGFQASHVLRRWGWTLPLGLLFLVLALGIQLFGISVVTEKLADLDRDVVRLEAHALKRQSVEAPPVILPPEAALPELIRTVMESAQKQGVATESGEYRQSREGRITRCRLVLPVRATYPQLRAWLAETLNSHPTLSLDDLSLHRSATVLPTLEGRVHLSLYLEAAP